MNKKIPAIGVVVVVVLAVGWYGVFFRAEKSHINELRAQQQSAIANVDQLQAQYSNMVLGEKTIPQEKRELSALTKAIPHGPELDNALLDVYQGATECHVTLASAASPQPANYGPVGDVGQSASSPAELTLTVDASGTPSEIEHYVNLLDSEPRLFVVDSFSLTLSGAGGASQSGQSSSDKGQTTSFGAVTSTPIAVRVFFSAATSANPAS